MVKPKDKTLISLVIISSHSHKPYHRVLNTPTENTNHFRHPINTGSFGKPKDGNPQGGYVILTLHSYSNSTLQESVEVEFVRFDYDVEKAAGAIEASPLPVEFADMLRKAY